MFTLPEIPVSTGAIILDAQGRLLILKPTYKSGWTIPGGIMEADGETPWQACRREVGEETGLEVQRGHLVCVDTRPAKKGRKLGLRLLFHCGEVSDEQITRIQLQLEEISEYRFVALPGGIELLRPAVRRRVSHGLKAGARCRYLENGKRVEALS
ncbi:NUDIX domain-containing protein [Gephyromycinifex aptenodytis]|uniref:NUDIX domain-containing protein n=1 Tax=Gephyromycinifex aptenodytis TaxID=2716227 RepID=UPI001447A058|nr:NUDIX hydrolase [Gephyromycinifex aptenodytis]